MPVIDHWDDAVFRAFTVRTTTLGQAGPITQHHPQYPFVGQVDIPDFARLGVEVDRSIRKLVSEYLSLTFPFLLGVARDEFQLFSTDGLADVGIFNEPANGFRIAWLPLKADPNHSFLLPRFNPTSVAAPVDGSLALFAVQVWEKDNPLTAMRNGLGIRVDASLWPLGGSQFALRIEGASLSAGLLQAMTRRSPAPASLTLSSFLASNALTFARLGDILSPLIASAAGFDRDLVVVEGVSTEPTLGNAHWMHVFAHAMRPSSQSLEPAYAIAAMVDFESTGPVVVSVTTAPLVAHATGGSAPPVRAGLFAHDPGGGGDDATCLAEPASQAGPGNLVEARPNRSSIELEHFRHPIALAGLGAGRVLLREPSGWFEVRQSKLVDRAANQDNVQLADGGSIKAARSNDFAAVSAYRQLCDLFEKIAGFGLQPLDLFRFSNFPIIVRYRATMLRGPGKDGKTVNAQVDFDPPDIALGTVAPTAPAPNPRKSMQIRMALADVQRSSSGREPLGIAADARWNWHEFGHLLLAGSTGKLEFAFAHSAGDALAAIVSDPRSRLAADTRRHGMRGATFPWVYLNRRHDRQVELGWSWSGTYHRPLRFDLTNCNCRHKGYESEQILSTTLFRLYRALGGDTVNWASGASAADLDMRLDASDYTAYLVLRAIGSLGSSASMPAQTVEQFANALVYADIATQHSTTGLLKNRVGGCAYKVVRWAFEQQGLYAGVAADRVHDAVGLPPAVDVYIDDLRSTEDATHKAGEYTPVSLDWRNATPPWPTASPPWHASAQGMSIDRSVPANPKLTVMVGNRGTSQATEVNVSGWYVAWPQGVEAPPWNRNNWTPLSPAVVGPATIASKTSSPFGPFTGLPASSGRYLLLAEVHARGDRANTFNDTAAGPLVDDLPCALGDARLVDLVAGDNNLGLLVYTVP